VVVRLGSGVAVVAVALSAFSTAACSPSGGAPAGTISVVASTNVYGDIAAQVAGRLAGGKIRITSLISDPAIDPHSYEANARDELAISRADLIVENGGGYDDFVDTMRSAADTKAPVINAVAVSGKSGDPLNEHVWYDPPTVEKVADHIARFLESRLPAEAAIIRRNAAAFAAKLHTLEAAEARIRAAHVGAGVAITEPVPLYLLEACGLVNQTPTDFSKAVEEGSGVPLRVLHTTLDLFAARQVKLLVYNDQTSGVETEQVLAAAKDNHIPTVPVSELLPSGKTYVTWIGGLLASIRSALGG
jgi:zinc/manganese transport system substrate-binding protein